MCKLCETKSVYEFTNQRKLCKTCFLSWFEKKFFYIMRKFGLVKQGEKVSLKVGKDFRGVVLKHVLGIWIERAGAEKGAGGKIAVSDTTDVVAMQFVKDIFENKKRDLGPVVKHVVKPLYLFLDKEVKLYADLIGLKYSKGGMGDSNGVPSSGGKDISEEGKGRLEKFVEGLEKNHPEIKRAIVNSYLALQN